MSTSNNDISELKKRIRKLQEENEYLKSPLYHYEILETIKGTYSILLNPPLVKLYTTKGQKACNFDININDIICVISAGKTKWIYFNKPQTSVYGERFVSDKISYTGNIEDFCTEFDKPQVHLLKISRSVVINLSYYYLNSKKVQLLGTLNPYNKCNNITISPSYVEDFVIRKSALDNIISFQKIQFRG